jgi:hypothetical protein
VGQPVAQPDLVRLLAAHPATGVEQPGGGLPADRVGEGHGQAEAMMEAQPGKVGREPALGAGHPEVGRQRQPEASADRRSADRGDHRQLGLEQSQRVSVQVADRPLGAAGEVRPGTEVPALGAQHDGPARTGLELLVRVGDRRDQRDIEEVVGRTVQLDRGDMVVAKLHRDVAHRVGDSSHMAHTSLR